MKNNQKKEKVALCATIISIAGLVVAIALEICNFIIKLPILDTIAVYGLVIFILPFVAFQFVMTAGISKDMYGEIPKAAMWLFYLIIFPFSDIWFFSGINALFNIIPDYHVADTMMRPILRNDYMRESLCFIAGIYCLLIGLGLVWRSLGSKNKAILIA